MEEDDGCITSVAETNELRRLVRFGRKQDVVVRDDTDGETMNVSPTTDESGTVEGFELDESRAVDDPADELTNFPGLSNVRRGYIEDLLY